VRSRKATIDWVATALGGRRAPPLGTGEPPYATVVRFPDTGEPWPPSVAWTLVVRKLAELESPLKWLADVQFLMAEAPHQLLTPGRAFELYEGARCVARGRVTE
jgi:hypothetical protein